MSDMNHLEVTSALYEVGTAAALAVAAAAAAAPNEQAKVGDVAANLGPEGGEEVEGEEEEGEEEEEGDAGEVLPATVTQPVSELPVAQHSPVGRIPKKTKKPDSPSADDMNSGGELNGNTNTNNSNGTDGDDKDDDDDEAQLWYEDKSGGSEEKNISVIPGTGASGTEAVPFQNAFIGGIGGGGGVSGDDDDDDDSEFKLPHGVQLPATIPVDLISEKIGRMLYQLPPDDMNHALLEYDEAVRSKGDIIRSHQAYLHGVVKRYVNLREKGPRAVEATDKNILKPRADAMGDALTELITTRLKGLIDSNFCQADDLNERVVNRVKMLSEKDAMAAIDELSSVNPSQIRNFAAYFLGIINRYIKGEGRQQQRERDGKRGPFQGKETERKRRDYGDRRQDRRDRSYSPADHRRRARDDDDDYDRRRGRSRSRSPDYRRRSRDSDDDSYERHRARRSGKYDDDRRRDRYDRDYDRQPGDRSDSFSRRKSRDIDSPRSRSYREEASSRFGPKSSSGIVQQRSAIPPPPPPSISLQQPVAQQAQINMQAQLAALLQQPGVVGQLQQNPQLLQQLLQQSQLKSQLQPTIGNPAGSMQAAASMMSQQLNPAYNPQQLVSGIVGAQPALSYMGHQPSQLQQSLAQTTQQQQQQQQQMSTGLNQSLGQFQMPSNMPSMQYQQMMQGMGQKNDPLGSMAALASQGRWQTNVSQTPASSSGPTDILGLAAKAADAVKLLSGQQQSTGSLYAHTQPLQSSNLGSAMQTMSSGPVGSETDLPVTIQFALQNLRSTGFVEGSQLDQGLIRLLKELPVDNALEALQSYSSCDISRVRSKTAYLAGILKQAKNKLFQS